MESNDLRLEKLNEKIDVMNERIALQNWILLVLADAVVNRGDDGVYDELNEDIKTIREKIVKS